MTSVMGSQVYVADLGSGSPVLFLHGNPDSSNMWHGVMAMLRDHCRCIAPDFPGFGQSEFLDDPAYYTLEGQADFVEELYAALGLAGPVRVVAHDFGGIFAAAWLTKFPARVSHAVFINTGFTSRYRWHFLARVWRTPILGELSLGLMNLPMFRHELRRGSPGLSQAYMDDAYRSFTGKTKKTVLRLYRGVQKHALAEWEERFLVVGKVVPVMVLWGEGDPYLPGEIAESFGARRVMRFPGAGHWLPVVEAEGVAAELVSFFEL